MQYRQLILPGIFTRVRQISTFTLSRFSSEREGKVRQCDRREFEGRAPAARKQLMFRCVTSSFFDVGRIKQPEQRSSDRRARSSTRRNTDRQTSVRSPRRHGGSRNSPTFPLRGEKREQSQLPKHIRDELRQRTRQWLIPRRKDVRARSADCEISSGDAIDGRAATTFLHSQVSPRESASARNCTEVSESRA